MSSSGDQSPYTNPKSKHKIQLDIRFSKLDIPSLYNFFLIGKKAPINSETIHPFVNAIFPEQYELIYLEHPIFEALIIKKLLLKQIPLEKLLPIILEEGEQIATEEIVINAQMDVCIQVNREIDLQKP
ncbi:MAG TPA: hypothetical protein DDW50_17430 [Firmicutes bacterium]|jgi:hypothetical protein|nr:hypothetical protein [Bacillota bacterium]